MVACRSTYISMYNLCSSKVQLNPTGCLLQYSSFKKSPWRDERLYPQSSWLWITQHPGSMLMCLLDAVLTRYWTERMGVPAEELLTGSRCFSNAEGLLQIHLVTSNETVNKPSVSVASMSVCFKVKL